MNYIIFNYFDLLFFNILEVKSLAQQLVDKWLKVVKTEQWHSMMSDKESLANKETLVNLIPDTVGNLNLNVPKTDSGTSLELLSDTNSDSKTKVDKTKNKMENDKVKERNKKEKIILNVKTKDDREKNKDKSKFEKEKVKDKIKEESDESKEKKRRTKEKNGNPFLRIIGEMTDDKSDEDKISENDVQSKNSSRRKQNLKNLSSGERFMKLKLSSDGKKNNSDNNPSSDSKKESKPILQPAPKPKLPESKTLMEKKNYSIHVEKKEYVGEKKSTVKTFKSKFRSTGLEEQAPPPPLPKSKVQSKKTTKNLVPLSLPKAEKRSLSPPSDSPNEKKLKSSPSSDTKKPPRKILIFYLFIFSVSMK